MEGTRILTGPESFSFELFALLLYAETHYRFRYFFSYLRKGEPEIIADAPFRVEPGGRIPVMLLIKDADTYPCRLERVGITVIQNRAVISTRDVLKASHVSKKWWWRIWEIETKGLTGWVDVQVDVEINGQRRNVRYRNDNHRTSSKRPLRIYLAKDFLPRFTGMYLGDAHTHSSATDDQVEFGAPLEASVRLSQSLGLSFFATTDHSYDLDDREDNYLINDPRRPKWAKQQAEIDSLAVKYRDFVILRGEETSCRNTSGHNVHLLLFGNENFVEGSGDGAEKWFRTRSEHSVTDIVGTKRPPVLAFAAHPFEDVPFLQRVLLHRGTWTDRDLGVDGLSGLQFANGSLKSGFRKGLSHWVRVLLSGRKLIAVAGNDAHGNFNRFRQIGIPFLFIRESNEHVFGAMRTGVFLRKPVSWISILEAISGGNCIITDGPVARLAGRTSGGRTFPMGSQTMAREVDVSINATSSPEFGTLQSIVVWKGVIGATRETAVYKAGIDDYTHSHSLKLKVTRGFYLRLEIRTSPVNDFDGKSHFCITNPVWISPP